MRTVRQALEHAKQQEQYAMPEAPNLVGDLILVANELNRLRSYSCHHPITEHPNSGFISVGLARANVFGDPPMFEGVPLVVDADIRQHDAGLHLPQPDGSCIRYNV